MKLFNKYFLYSLFLFLSFACFNFTLAQTEITLGEISQDTTWTKDAGPYVLHTDLVVDPDITLSIDAGTVIKFDYSTGVYVQGKLVVSGDITEKVYFTSLYNDEIGGDTDLDDGLIVPYNTDWTGITIGDGGNVSLDNTEISYTENGLTVDSSTGNITNSSFINCQNAINVINDSVLTIDNTNIENTLGDALFLYQGNNVSIKNSNINNIGGDSLGVFYNSILSVEGVTATHITGQVLYMYADSSTDIKNSHIENTKDGMLFYNNSYVKIFDSDFKNVSGYPFVNFYQGSHLNFTNSTAEGITGTVLVAYGASWDGHATTTFTISSSTISNGDGTGFQVYGDKFEIDISKSKISNFAGDAIQTFSYPYIKISDSELSGNNTGITSWGANIDIKNSIIFDNRNYGISNNPIESGAPTILAVNNWWGDKSGPFNLDTNASGTANQVSWNVTYTPWLISKPGEKTECCSNVMFLPGLEASRLYRPDYDGGTKRLWEPEISHNNSDIFLDPTGTSIREDIYTKDIIDNAYLPIKGNIYSSFISSMNKMKADELINDWAAVPYDWRLSLEELLNNGRKYSDGRIYYSGENGTTSDPYIISELRRLASSSATGKVTIVAHSNGGLLSKELTNKLGDEASILIDKIIFVAVPQAGTPAAIGALLHGFDQGLPTDLLPLFISPAESRELGLNMSSAYNLLPSSQYFDYVSTPVITFDNSDILTSWRAKYGSKIDSGESLYNFLSDQSREILETKSDLVSIISLNKYLLDNSKELHDIKLDNWTPPTGISIVEIAGWGEETLSGIEYYQGIKTECINNSSFSSCPMYVKTPILEYNPKTTFDGDGTVVIPSALWMANSTGVEKYWVDLDDYDTLLNIQRKHADILEVSQLNDFIKNIVVQSTSSLPKYISTSTPINPKLGSRLQFTLHSPLSLDLYDEQGNHTGISTSTNEIEENIPGSNYLTFGEVKYISVPASSTIYLTMNGYSSGSFTLNIEEVENNIVTASTTFAGIPSSTSTIATTSVPDGNIASTSQLNVDINGDGKIEINLLPKLGEIVTPVLSRDRKDDGSDNHKSYSHSGGWLPPIHNNYSKPTTTVIFKEHKDNKIQSTSTINKKIYKKDKPKKVVVDKITSIKTLDKYEPLVASVGNVSLSNKFSLLISNIFRYFKTLIK